jgi:hypothetical protein
MGWGGQQTAAEWGVPKQLAPSMQDDF